MEERKEERKEVGGRGEGEKWKSIGRKEEKNEGERKDPYIFSSSTLLYLGLYVGMLKCFTKISKKELIFPFLPFSLITSKKFFLDTVEGL